MNDMTKTDNNIADGEPVKQNDSSEQNAIETLKVYEQSAALYRDGKKAEAVELIRASLGAEEAEEAMKIMNEADQMSQPEVVTPTEETTV